jgi:hypothetical protein
MREALLLASAFLAGAVGMVWFALAKLPHWRQVTGREIQADGTRRALRIGGSAALAVCLALCLVADHISMSFLVWIMIQAAAALGVAMMLAYRPRALAGLAFQSATPKRTS